MVSLTEKKDDFKLTVQVSRTENRILITVNLYNTSDEPLKFTTSTPKWCEIFLYDSENNSCLESRMTTAAFKTRVIEPGERLQRTRKTDTKEDWKELAEDLSIDLDKCRYVELNSETEDFTAHVKITLDINTPKMSLSFTPSELPYRDG